MNTTLTEIDQKTPPHTFLGVRHAFRVRGEGTRYARLRMSAGEVAYVAVAKRGGGRGREKSAKEEKREGWCFCIPPGTG